MPYSRGRVTFLYAVAGLSLGASFHAFVTEGVGVSGIVSALLAIVLSWEATRQLQVKRMRDKDKMEESNRKGWWAAPIAVPILVAAVPANSGDWALAIATAAMGPVALAAIVILRQRGYWKS